MKNKLLIFKNLFFGHFSIISIFSLFLNNIPSSSLLFLILNLVNKSLKSFSQIIFKLSFKYDKLHLSYIIPPND